MPADSVHMHVVDAIHTRMGASDDISRGRSTFLEVSSPFPALCVAAFSKILLSKVT